MRTGLDQMSYKILGNYQIMITSKYFESIEDYINLEIAVKRFTGSMERFHFNPIPLNDNTRKFFPNLETLHLYNEDDQIFNDGRIYKHCIWYRINYERYLKEKGNDCKLIYYSHTDRKKFGNEIPKEVKILDASCYFLLSSLKSITIPSSVVEIEKYCFSYCQSLTSIELSTQLKRLRKGCFSHCTQLSSINIPTSITKIGKFCFDYCLSLKSIEIPNSVCELNSSSFFRCLSLTSICIPSSVCITGDKLINGIEIQVAKQGGTKGEN